MLKVLRFICKSLDLENLLSLPQDPEHLRSRPPPDPEHRLSLLATPHPREPAHLESRMDGLYPDDPDDVTEPERKYELLFVFERENFLSNFFPKGIECLSQILNF